MKVRCVNTGGEALLAADIASGNTRSSVFHVTLARDYTVYGVVFCRSVLDYLVQADTGSPQWTPASLFQVVCGRVSRHWVFADWSSTEYIAAMTFAEFTESPEAFDQLVEGDDAACGMFYTLQQSADLEFVDPSVTKAAEAIDGNWVLCPVCSDAWEFESTDAMVRCPKCQSVLRSPRCQAE
jgi:uncharacterized CHY-type Zn-finger protein